MLASPSPAGALEFNDTIKIERNCPITFTAKSTERFTFRVWRLIRWQRGKPKPTTVRVYRKRLACAAGPGHRAAIKRRWRRSRAAYTRHRERKLAERRAEEKRLRYLPFDCGGGVRSAIPCGTMFCESGGSYTVVNPASGARGKYQFLPSTYAIYCHACDWSPADQDHAAYDLYREAGGGPWVCA